MILLPRTRQPQFARINYRNPITQNIAHVLNFNTAAPIDLVTGNQFVLSGAPGPITNPRGLALRTAAASSQYGYVPTNLTAAPITMLWVGRLATFPGAAQAILSLGTASGTERAVMFAGSVASSISGSVIPNQGGATDPSTSASAGLIVAAQVIGPDTINQIFVNGVASTNGTTTWLSTNAATRLYVGARVNSTPGVFLDGETNAVFAWRRALSVGELQSLYANPWQIFAPEVIYVKAASAGAYTLTAAAGTFTETGQAANLLAARTIAGAAGSFTETGQDAGLIAARTIAGAAGSFTETGQDAGLLATRTIGGGTGAFTLTGQDAALTYTPAGAYSMPAAAGSFSETGQDAALLYARLMASDAGAFAFTGQAASLVYTPAGSYSMSAAAGSFAMTGQSANLAGPFVALPNRRRIGRASMTAANARIGAATGRPINARIGD